MPHQRGSGQVINVSSGLAYTMRATEAAYVATKAAVLALSRCLRADWHDSGVGVSAICPGVINTPIIDKIEVAATRYDAVGAVVDRKVLRRDLHELLDSDATRSRSVRTVIRNRPQRYRVRPRSNRWM